MGQPHKQPGPSAVLKTGEERWLRKSGSDPRWERVWRPRCAGIRVRQAGDSDPNTRSQGEESSAYIRRTADEERHQSITLSCFDVCRGSQWVFSEIPVNSPAEMGQRGFLGPTLHTCPSCPMCVCVCVCVLSSRLQCGFLTCFSGDSPWICLCGPLHLCLRGPRNAVDGWLMDVGVRPGTLQLRQG